MKIHTKVTLVVAISGCGLAVVFANRGGERTEARAPSSSHAVVPPSSGYASTRAADIDAGPAADGEAASAASAVDASRPPLVSARWGSGARELGHARPEEGNPEGPMSFAASNGALLVLDQINGRVVRYDEQGRMQATATAPTTAQDIAVARDGSMALLDRLVDKSVTLLDRGGRKVGQLALDPAKVGEPGLLTGIFVDGDDVYVERDHGALVRVGSIDGRARDGAELSGRPSKDGSLLLTATMASAQAGQVVLNAIDRKTRALRFARQIAFPRPVGSIVLLDSDASGGVFLGTVGGPDDALHVACLDGTDGHVLARLSLPTSDVPEESFRDVVVRDDGGIVYAVRTDDGVALHVARCR